MRGPVRAATAGRRPDMLRYVRAVFWAWALLGVVLAADAQESQPARLTFDVVSVKRSAPDAGGSMVGDGRGQYQAINVPVRVTITNAWNLRDHQIVGAPDWLARDRFDIVAKEPAGTFTEKSSSSTNGSRCRNAGVGKTRWTTAPAPSRVGTLRSLGSATGATPLGAGGDASQPTSTSEPADASCQSARRRGMTTRAIPRA